MPLPALERRLQNRYVTLVKEQADVCRKLSAGLSALPGVTRAFSSTQAAWRFYDNDRVTGQALIEPLRQAVREDLSQSSCDYYLAVIDWSKIDYSYHDSKKDRRKFCNDDEYGYALTTVLAVDAATGDTLGPLELELQAGDGTHTTRNAEVVSYQHFPEQTHRLLQGAKDWAMPRQAVIVADREYDGVDHYRRWHQEGHLFLVRADNQRLVCHEGQEIILSKLADKLCHENAFRESRCVDYKGKSHTQFVAEAPVVLHRPGWKRGPDRKRQRLAGEPLTLRLVVAEIRDEQGKTLARWLLLTSVPEIVPAESIALWYYWRWRIESMHLLLKSAGLHVEDWQQETAKRTLCRLLVACMACVTIWRLMGQNTPEAEECKDLLVRLSGRQMKWGVKATAPALLAGLHILLIIQQTLQAYGIETILKLGEPILKQLRPP